MELQRPVYARSGMSSTHKLGTSEILTMRTSSMSDNWIVLFLITVVVDVIVVFFVVRYTTNTLAEKFRSEQQNKVDNIVSVAEEKAKGLELGAKDRAIKIMQDTESESSRRRSELAKEEERLQKRRAEFDHRLEKMELREQTISKRQGALDKRTNDVEKMVSQQVTELQRIAQLTTEEARTVVLAETEKESRNDMARIIRQVEGEARAEGDKRAREIIADAIQRVASEHVSEVSTSVVALPNEEMKGRIVGRNGRNIRAFEQAAG
ncbi:MAG: Rnase Y domain-containing protein, partial [Saprospiraceae bacterium]|nr:Rnase Y domain-containing protein [Saprospiraceae bacterium]